MDTVLTHIRHIILRHRYRSSIDHRVEKIFGSESVEYHLLMEVIDLVSETHDNGHRHNGDLLKSHEFAMFTIALVYCGIRDLSILLSILLHDMVEDYPEIWMSWIIRERFGAEVEAIVLAVTKPSESDYTTDAEYEEAVFERVLLGGWKAIVVKCIDRLHNMLTLYGGREKMVKKVLQTIKFVLPLSASIEFLTFELMQATSEQMSRLNMKQTRSL
jgi:(p)ppGpp synthase/HD superfamily hydrolase